MTQDQRESRNPQSEAVTFASGDSGTSKDLVTIKAEETFSIHDIAITQNSAQSNSIDVEFYDDDAGTSLGSASKLIDEYELASGDSVIREDVARTDVENDLLVGVRNNNDDVTISVGGYIVTG